LRWAAYAWPPVPDDRGLRRAALLQQLARLPAKFRFSEWRWFGVVGLHDLPQEPGVRTTLRSLPDPIPVCGQPRRGATTLSWRAPLVEEVELRVGAPDGRLLARLGPIDSVATGRWVTEGMTFYLQDVTGGLPLAADHTLAVLVAHLTDEGCSDRSTSSERQAASTDP
jgi:hypothetical protein